MNCRRSKRTLCCTAARQVKAQALFLGSQHARCLQGHYTTLACMQDRPTLQQFCFAFTINILCSVSETFKEFVRCRTICSQVPPWAWLGVPHRMHSLELKLKIIYHIPRICLYSASSENYHKAFPASAMSRPHSSSINRLSHQKLYLAIFFKYDLQGNFHYILFM